VAKKGNDGRILVEVAANAQPRHDLALASPDEEMALEMDMVRRELAAAHLALVKAEGERDTAIAKLQAERDAALAMAAAKVEAGERVVAELRAMLADARRPWWQRLVGA
jgi:leucyl aminopeptidase (aminopeptidase T)